jgi:Bacterial membrane protein YfhO
VGLFLSLFAAGAFFIGGATPLEWVAGLTSPGSSIHSFVMGIRHPTVMTSLAVPPLLGLAAFGVDKVLRFPPFRASVAMSWSRWQTRRPLRIRLDLGLLMIVPMFLALQSAHSFAGYWLGVVREPADKMTPVIEGLKTDDLQWVDVPYGEIFWVVRAMESGLKLSSNVTVWSWAGRKDPIAVLRAHRSGVPADYETTTIDSPIPVYRSTIAKPYAHVIMQDGSVTPCIAQGRGGDVDVTCDTTQPGTLVVQENSYSGWNADVNGKSVDVGAADTRWLGVPIEPGHSVVKLRYRPWDVPLGLLLGLIGLGLAAVSIVRTDAHGPVRIGRGGVDGPRIKLAEI